MITQGSVRIISPTLSAAVHDGASGEVASARRNLRDSVIQTRDLNRHLTVGGISIAQIAESVLAPALR
jgi:hypothetical protein